MHNQKRLFIAVVALILGFRTGILDAQVSSSPEATQAVSVPALSSGRTPAQREVAVLAYQKEQRALGSEYRALVASGASPEQVQQWEKNNASRFQTQAQRAQALTGAFKNNTLADGGTIRLPTDASPTLVTFARNEAGLHRSIATSTIFDSAQNAQATTLNQTGSMAVASQTATFVQQNASLLSEQRQMAITLAANASHRETLSPNAMPVPKGVGPQMAALISTRNLLIQRLSEFQNQYANADAGTRELAMAQWRKQNAALILQLQTEASSFSTATKTQSAQLQN